MLLVSDEFFMKRKVHLSFILVIAERDYLLFLEKKEDTYNDILVFNFQVDIFLAELLQKKSFNLKPFYDFLL